MNLPPGPLHISLQKLYTAKRRTPPPGAMAVGCLTLPPGALAVAKGSNPENISKWGQILNLFGKRVKTRNLASYIYRATQHQIGRLPTVGSYLSVRSAPSSHCNAKVQCTIFFILFITQYFSYNKSYSSPNATKRDATPT